MNNQTMDLSSALEEVRVAATEGNGERSQPVINKKNKGAKGREPPRRGKTLQTGWQAVQAW